MSQKLKPIHLLYDERMTLHRRIKQNPNSCCFENSTRIVSIHEQILALEERLLQDVVKEIKSENERNSVVTEHGNDESGTKVISQRMSDTTRCFLPLSCTPADQQTVELAHTSSHFEKVRQTSEFPDEKLIELTEKADEDDDDVYYSKDTFLAATLACGGVVECVDAVMRPQNSINRAIAIVRPPGHHACEHKAMGFCFFNSVAVAAKHAINSRRAKKVFILDWDVHHGNGTQNITYNDPNIFYVSLHRAAFGTNSYFYPMTGRPDEIGEGLACGTNLNIAWCASGMGNNEYAAAMSELILPLISLYSPDLIIISCGFDAAKGDLLGDCELMPQMYYDMTLSILETAGVDIPFVVALEGGYNVEVIAFCMEAVAMALLNQPYNEEDFYEDEGETKENVMNESLKENIDSTIEISLDFKKLSISHSNDKRKEMLQNGRSILSKYWNQNSDNPHRKGRVKKAAIRAINKSIKAIREAPMWRGILDINEISSQIFEEGHTFEKAGMQTRSKTKENVII